MAVRYISVISLMFACSGCTINKYPAAGLEHENHVAEITLEKEGCPSGCPEYTMTLTRPKRVILTGRANMEHIGNFHFNLNRSLQDSIWRVIDQANFMEMKDQYHIDTEDTQMRILHIKWDGTNEEKRILFKALIPHDLTAVEKMLDRLAASGEWKRD
ncbi:MAG: hypothetical protein H6585_05070 [Flavobacteriales bacterium]|nr:hypothetical protein [Flavobacteriales bacterium]MCB9447699.1 hypothetical protein [Flavobacteriales bacterium]